LIDANYDYRESRWQDVYNILKKNSIDVYSPGQKDGICLEKYVVIKEGGSTQFETYTTDKEYIQVLCYVPLNRYSELRVFVETIKDILSELRPMIRLEHDESSSFYDDNVKAHMISFSCYYFKKWR
jgi:hypothetical protein